jgi:hypothetical protein
MESGDLAGESPLLSEPAKAGTEHDAPDGGTRTRRIYRHVLFLRFVD